MLSNKKMEALKNFTEHQQRLFLSNDLNKWVQGSRVLLISFDGDDRRIFLSLKFSIPVLLLLGKF